MERRSNVLDVLNAAVKDFVAASLRITIIFTFMLLTFDSLSRVYYTYMPISTWINFRDVSIENRRGEAYVVLERTPVGRQIAMFHRSLVIRYPEPEHGCTASLLTVLDNPSADTLVIPMKRIVSPTCPDVLNGRRVDGMLQVSYIFEFPYGVKRTATRYSKSFSLEYRNGRYVAGKPLSRDFDF